MSDSASDKPQYKAWFQSLAEAWVSAAFAFADRLSFRHSEDFQELDFPDFCCVMRLQIRCWQLRRLR